MDEPSAMMWWKARQTDSLLRVVDVAESEKLRRKVERFANLFLYPPLRVITRNRTGGNLELAQVAAECEYRSVAIVLVFPDINPAAQGAVSGHQQPQGINDVRRMDDMGWDRSRDEPLLQC